MNKTQHSVVLKGVTKSYDDQQVLKSIDMELEKGKFYTLLGYIGYQRSVSWRSCHIVQHKGMVAWVIDG